MQNFNQTKEEFKKIEDWLMAEFKNLRTGRASISALDSIKVESYGSLVPINQTATISQEDPKTLRISPWDTTLIKPIEKAIIVSNLGLSAVVDEKGLRLVFPELTSERRGDLVKVCKQKLEEGKISIRNERERVLKDFEKKQKDGEMSEDQKFRLKNDLQKLVDEASKKLDDIFAKKEKEIIE
jgi:ribosome recycling factor